MGLGDEIMALGRVERKHEESGQRVSVLEGHGTPRDHIAWHGNPAWAKVGPKVITDGAGARPYVSFQSGRAHFNLEHTARAGRIHIPEEYRRKNRRYYPYAIVSPHIKKGASPNKSYGFDRWAEVINDFPRPVLQPMADDQKVLPGAIPIRTPHLYDVLALVEGAAVVLCNEGGMHHMAASMRVPAVVFFGSFIPPTVTGYDFHYNLAVDSDHGYCGRWDTCDECSELKKQITPGMVREKAILLMESFNAD